MSNSVVEKHEANLPGRTPAPLDRAMASLPTLWGRLVRGLENGRPALIEAIREAEMLDHATVAEIRDVGHLATADETLSFLRMLVSAWPNASQNDLAGYGLQLRLDVEDHRPSRYALAEAARHLRRTSRFLPSISEVLDAIGRADKKMTDVLKTLDRIPPALIVAKDVERQP